MEMNASIANKDLAEKVVIDIEKNLESQPDVHQACIYRVPQKIRSPNAEAFTPTLISIGPLHNGKAELANMEKKKKMYVKSFLERKTIDKALDEILIFIKKNEENIRNSYAEISRLESLDYIMMVLYDAIFILEIFLRDKFRDRSDLLITIDALKDTLRLDLQLLENQLPYFVLEGIYELTLVGLYVPTFMELSCSFFTNSDHDLNPLAPVEIVKHFIDWRRSTLIKNHPKEESEGWINDLPCAMKLHESGVKFKSVERECLLDIKLEKQKQDILWLNELQIPHFNVNLETEHLLRNILAFEQCHYPSDIRVCNYIFFLNRLIYTEKDVDLLVRKGIISNTMGDSASVANMFTDVCKYMHEKKSSHYPKICEELKEHYNNRWNRTKIALRRAYFNNIWRGTTTAAFILFLLILIQTCILVVFF